MSLEMMVSVRTSIPKWPDFNFLKYDQLGPNLPTCPMIPCSLDIPWKKWGPTSDIWPTDPMWRAIRGRRCSTAIHGFCRWSAKLNATRFVHVVHSPNQQGIYPDIGCHASLFFSIRALEHVDDIKKKNTTRNLEDVQGLWCFFSSQLWGRLSWCTG